jgi:hypothetical protein
MTQNLSGCNIVIVRKINRPRALMPPTIHSHSIYTSLIAFDLWSSNQTDQTYLIVQSMKVKIAS